MSNNLFNKGKFNYDEFIDRKKEPSQRAPSRVSALYVAKEVPFTPHNADAELINGAICSPDEYPPPENKYLFLGENYEIDMGNNPKTSITGEIIFAFSKNPVGESTGFDGIADLNGDIKKGVFRKSRHANIEPAIQYLNGYIDPKTGQLLCPVPVGYVVNEVKSWYSPRTLAGQSSCDVEWGVDRSEIKKSYYILDFILYLLSAEKIAPKSLGRNSTQRVFKINTLYGEKLLKESVLVP